MHNLCYHPGQVLVKNFLVKICPDKLSLMAKIIFCQIFSKIDLHIRMPIKHLLYQVA